MSESEKVDDDTCDSDCIPGGPHSNACVARAQFSYVPPSPAAPRPLVTRESYAQYADDEQLTDEERTQLELAVEVENYPIAKLLRLHDRYKARVEELERFAAVAILTHIDAEGCGGPPEEQWPPEVKALVDGWRGHIGKCMRCKQWQPLAVAISRESVAQGAAICAPGWGCALKPPG